MADATKENADVDEHPTSPKMNGQNGSASDSDHEETTTTTTTTTTGPKSHQTAESSKSPKDDGELLDGSNASDEPAKTAAEADAVDPPPDDEMPSPNLAADETADELRDEAVNVNGAKGPDAAATLEQVADDIVEEDDAQKTDDEGETSSNVGDADHPNVSDHDGDDDGVSAECADDEKPGAPKTDDSASETNVPAAEPSDGEEDDGDDDGSKEPNIADEKSVTVDAADAADECGGAANEEEDEDDDEETEGAMAIDEDALNGADNSLDDCQHVPIVEEVHAISDSEDETNEATAAPSNALASPPHVEHMDVTENGHTNDSRPEAADEEDDAEKPVSIGSDSDNEDGGKNKKQNNGLQKSSPAHCKEAAAVEDDEEDDCMVIEDDDDINTKPDVNLLSPRRSGRSRKSVVQVRDFSRFDDDIEEIADDPLCPQPALKKQKTSPMSITIQDARSLAADPLGSAAGDGSAARKKEPTLVIIDTNQLMGRGGGSSSSSSTAASVQALQNQNISVHPVMAGAQSSSPGGGVYPTNLRASITPVSMATITKSPISGGGAHHLNNNSGTTITKTNAAPGTAAAAAAAANLLPALTDDMFVLEAPSFIVPYIYEKPPGDQLRDIVERIGRELAEQKKAEDIEVAENEAKELEAMSEEQRKLAELARAADANKKKASAKWGRRKPKSGDESWDESDTSTDDEASDTDQPQRTKVLIQEADTDPLNAAASLNASGALAAGSDPSRRDNYFESPLGRFFMDIGVNLVQEHVQTDLLRQQKKKLHREGETAAPSVKMAISSLTKNLEHSKTKNDIFKFETKRCEYCNFKSESALAMAHHYEAPHLNGQQYRCNFCPFEARPPYDILFHMEAMHNVKARLEKAQTYHQCPNCPFEDNGKSKLARHAAVCLKKFRPEVNLNPPVDWEPPAKIPRIKPRHGLVGTATAYQAMAAQAQRSATSAAAAAALSMQQRQQNMANAAAMMRGRGRPQQQMQQQQQSMLPKAGMLGNNMVSGGMARNNSIQLTQMQQQHLQQPHVPQQLSRQQLANLSVPNNYHLNAAGHFVQTPNSNKSSSKSSQQQPSISITPLPRQPAGTTVTPVSLQMAGAHSKATASGLGNSAGSPVGANMKPGQAVTPGQKSFVICEICDGYIKDLDQLRNHMQWMHKVKIHPKMIYNRPPLNCQKCQFRFFTDQGLERHLLGSHGLVTSSMQEAANKGKDAGRCPVCGRMYQWKLLNHVSRDHNMTLKPAHLSYKCTVCTATFGMYKQFENHVYSAHSTVAKKAMDGKTKSGASGSASSSGGGASGSKSGSSCGDSLLKPLKINDEITIIPQPASSRQSRGGGGGGGSSGAGSSSTMDSHVIEIL